MAVAETAEKIRALEIQGATNVALEAVKALAAELRGLEWVERGEALECLEKSIGVLVASRPTEPLMRNGLRFVESRVLESEWGSPSELAGVVGGAEADFLGMVERARRDVEYVNRLASRGVDPVEAFLELNHLIENTGKGLNIRGDTTGLGDSEPRGSHR